MTSLWLRERKYNITSQFGEDGVLAAIFEMIGTQNKWCCEFGAWDGIVLSNTRNLIMNHWWSAVLVESDPEKFQQLKRATDGVARVHSFQASVTPDNFEEILAKTPIPKDFDLLSVDVDGDDYHIWEALQSYRPRVVVMEVNTSFGSEVSRVPELGKVEESTQCGASFASMVELGKRKGYELASHTGNAIFVLRELGDRLSIDPGGWKELFDNNL